MSLKSNFLQAVKELIGSPSSSDKKMNEGTEAAPTVSKPIMPQVSTQPDVSAPIVNAPPILTTPSVNNTPITGSPGERMQDRLQKMLEHGGLVGDDLKQQSQAPTALDDLIRADFPRADAKAPNSRTGDVFQPIPPSRPSAGSGSFNDSAPSPTIRSGINNGGGELTIISKNTMVSGNIRSFANVFVEGTIHGDVTAVKNVDVTGKMVGDLNCDNCTLQGSIVQGNISTKGNVQMDKNAYVIGDFNAQNVDLDGKIKGNVNVTGKIGVQENSIILGDISASTIYIASGANIQGFVNTTFLKENSESVFQEEISTVSEDEAFSKSDK